ncbi:MAG: glycosyl hydrolase [Myxococcota bacterium]
MRHLGSLALCLLMACVSSTSGSPDASTDDAGTLDEGLPELGRPDVGNGDLGDPIEAMVARIDRTVEPEYEIAYEGARFVPPPGQTLLVLGQTVGGITEHVASFPDEPLPGGWAAYWGIPTTNGIREEFTAEQGGRQNHQWIVDTFPNAAIQSGLWMVGTWGVAADTAAGRYDDVVRSFGAWAKEVARPIYLRIGYEFDGPHNELEPSEYIAAYRRVVDVLRAEEVENVAFVWHSYAFTIPSGRPVTAWWPGTEYVDWVGVSLFGQMYGTPPRELDDVLAFALEERKPVMVAESTPTRGIAAMSDREWNEWFVNLFSFAYAKNIKAISLINEDWTRFTFGLGWGDARLQNNERISAAFFRETNGERYLKAGPELFETLGYTPPVTP